MGEEDILFEGTPEELIKNKEKLYSGVFETGVGLTVPV
jgi:hypothetical protein